MAVWVVSALDEAVEEGEFYGDAAVVDVEVESALSQRILNMTYNLFLYAGFVVAYVFVHEAPEHFCHFLIISRIFARHGRKYFLVNGVATWLFLIGHRSLIHMPAIMQKSRTLNGSF